MKKISLLVLSLFILSSSLYGAMSGQQYWRGSLYFIEKGHSVINGSLIIRSTAQGAVGIAAVLILGKLVSKRLEQKAAARKQHLEAQRAKNAREGADRAQKALELFKKAEEEKASAARASVAAASSVVVAPALVDRGVGAGVPLLPPPVSPSVSGWASSSSSSLPSAGSAGAGIASLAAGVSPRTNSLASEVIDVTKIEETSAIIESASVAALPPQGASSESIGISASVGHGLRTAALGGTVGSVKPSSASFDIASMVRPSAASMTSSIAGVAASSSGTNMAASSSRAEVAIPPSADLTVPAVAEAASSIPDAPPLVVTKVVTNIPGIGSFIAAKKAIYEALEKKNK